MAWGVRWRRDAGQDVVTGPSRAARTGAALRASGTIARTRPRAEQRRDGDGERGGRDVRVGREVALADLLGSAVGVEAHLLHVEGVLEVGGGRVVEREVAVLADPEAAEVEGVGGQQCGVAVALAGGRGESVDVVGGPGSGRCHDPLSDPAAEAGRVVLADPDVLVHVEDHHVLPGHIGGPPDELLDEGDLGIAGREHGVGDTGAIHRRADHLGGGAGRVARHRARVGRRPRTSGPSVAVSEGGIGAL